MKKEPRRFTNVRLILMDGREVGTLDEVFTSENFGNFHVPGMLDCVRRHQSECPLVRSYITVDFIEYIKESIDLLYPKIFALTRQQIDEPTLSMSLDGFEGCGPHDAFFVDGHHRIIARNMRGLTTYDTYLIPWKFRKDFDVTIEGLCAGKWVAMTNAEVLDGAIGTYALHDGTIIR